MALSQFPDAELLRREFGAVGGFLFEEAGGGVCGDGEGGWGGHFPFVRSCLCGDVEEEKEGWGWE